MTHTEKDTVLAHQLQDNENKKLLEKKGIYVWKMLKKKKM
jgi:hypothetical protein